MVKLQVRFVERNDCYVSLPRSLGSLLQQEYSANAICRALKLTKLDRTKVYVGFAGGLSKNENELEIAQRFAECLNIEEGEPVDVDSIDTQQTEARLELQVLNEDDYELVARMREKLEESLLNQISVVFDGLRFPAFFSASQFVVFKYQSSKAENDATCKIIHPSAELVILSPPQNHNQENNNQDQGEDDQSEEEELRLRTIEQYLGNEHRLLVSRKVFENHKLVEGKLYRVRVERVLKEGDYTDFKTYLNKQQRSSKPKAEESKEQAVPASESMVLIGISEDIEDDGTVLINYFMQRSLQIQNKSTIILDLKYELDNIKDNRVISLSEFSSLNNKIKLVFRQIHAKNQKQDLKVDHQSILHQILTRNKNGTQDGYYTDQIYQVNGNFYIVKILEIMQDSRQTLRMLLFDNASSSLQSSLNKSANNLDESSQLAQANSAMSQAITNSLIFVSQQDFFADFVDTDILAINKLVSARISPDKILPLKLGIFNALYEKELVKLENALNSSDNLPQQIITVNGKSQSGKTFMIEHLRHRYPSYHIECIDFAELQENVPLDYAKNYIASKIQLACIKAPGFLICDNTDRICQSLDRIDFQQFQAILVSEIISKYLKDALKKYANSNPKVKFIILADSKDLLNSNLHKILEIQVNLETASYAKRKKLFEHLKSVSGIELDVNELGSATENFTLNEFFILSQKIIQEKEIITSQQILDKISDLSNKSFKSTKNFPKFEHVGGLRDVKDTIRETFEVPIKYEFLFANIPIKLPRGVLLYGPPGCGKTYLAKATANELGLNFFSVKGPEILNKYIGASEQAVRDIFEKAYSVRPSIVFFDEFDAIVPRRNSGSTGVTDRVVNQFLCYLDGVASLEGVCILAASSRPDLIDPALLRPGRIDRHVYLGFPDEDERRLIFEIYGKNLKMEEGLSTEDLVQMTDQFTSSDLVAFLKEIRIKMAHDMIEEKRQNAEFEFDFTLTKQFCQKTFSSFRPSLNAKEVQKFEQMYSKFADPKAVQDISKQKQTLN